MLILAGRFVYDNNKVAVFNFGKHRGKSIEWVLETRTQLLQLDDGWRLSASTTKRVLTKVRLEPDESVMMRPQPFQIFEETGYLGCRTQTAFCSHHARAR